MMTDCISRQQAIEAIEKEIEKIRENPCAISEGDNYYQHALNLAQRIIELQPPVNQKQITIKLESAENATSEGEESTMGQPKSKLYIPLNQHTVERINRLHKDGCGDYFDEEWLYNELEQIAEILPPVTPKERTGKWFNHYLTQSENSLVFECSECGKLSNGRYNYCPNCGAKMGGDE